MNKTLAQLFEAYVVDTTIGRITARHFSNPVETMLALKIVHESRKRRINQGHDGLLRDAAIALVAEHLDDFAAYATRQDWRNGHYDRQQLMNGVADEIAKVTPTLKMKVESWLRSYRAELFEEAEYTQDFGSSKGIEHPMLTFTNAINMLDAAKPKPLPKDDRILYVNLTNLLRAGNAALKPHEWAIQAVGPDGKVYS